MESHHRPTRASGQALRHLGRVAAWVLCFFSAGGAAWAASPAAGTKILNQATITYTDAIGRDRAAVTNEVALIVQRVYAATLEADIEAARPAGADWSAESLALFTQTVLQGAFVVAKALGSEAGGIAVARGQVAHLRRYVEMILVEESA